MIFKPLTWVFQPLLLAFLFASSAYSCETTTCTNTSTGTSTNNPVSLDVPYCKECEGRGGTCGFQNNVSQQIGCFYSAADSGDMQQTGDSKGLKAAAFRIAAFSIAIAVLICAMAMGISLCIIGRIDRTSREQQETAPMPEPQEAPAGLDRATIDSYTKVVVLGESRRVPGLNEESCPICLSEFKPKETLRCIPDCQHCFHDDCIDEWLRMNGSCPLCRKSPIVHHLQV